MHLGTPLKFRNPRRNRSPPLRSQAQHSRYCTKDLGLGKQPAQIETQYVVPADHDGFGNCMGPLGRVPLGGMLAMHTIRCS